MAKRPQCDVCIVRTRAHGHGKRVKDQILFGDPVALCGLQNLFSDADAPLGRIGDTVLVERQADDRAAVFFGKRETVSMDSRLPLTELMSGFPL